MDAEDEQLLEDEVAMPTDSKRSVRCFLHLNYYILCFHASCKWSWRHYVLGLFVGLCVRTRVLMWRHFQLACF